MRFPDTAAFRAALAEAPAPDAEALAAAEARQATLTKPRGALGRLETLAVWWCGWRGVARGRLERPQIAVFAADHGVVAQGVSAFPAEVTAQMVANFHAGGAAINQLAETLGARLDVFDVGVGAPTADMTSAPAMDEAGLCAALSAGWDAVRPDADLFIAGEMGIGATTAAAALAAALHGGDVADWVGRGTGLDDGGLARKRDVVATALARHGAALADPLEALRRVGGRELAAMAGAVAGARARRIPVLLDGFIATAAAAALEKAAPGALDHCMAGHCSAEPGHRRLLDALGKAPLLALEMRLGEASGAAAAALLLKAALAAHDGMATFAEAGVSDG
jgi:nicotinate-nucleotide--dimethylbenzimidazole phosphoribosyltransferase